MFYRCVARALQVAWSFEKKFLSEKKLKKKLTGSLLRENRVSRNQAETLEELYWRWRKMKKNKTTFCFSIFYLSYSEASNHHGSVLNIFASFFPHPKWILRTTSKVHFRIRIKLLPSCCYWLTGEAVVCECVW